MASKNEKLAGEDRVSITLPKYRDGKSNTVYVSVNDRDWLIRRGETVSVPRCAYEVLMNSERALDAAEAYSESRAN